MKIIILICFITSATPVLCQNKHVRIYLYGEFPKWEVYLIKYKGEAIYNKGLKGFVLDSIDILIDTTKIEPFQFMPIDIYKARGKYYNDTRSSIFYEPDRNVILLERSNRLKKRYALQVRWVNYYDDNKFWPEIDSKRALEK